MPESERCESAVRIGSYESVERNGRDCFQIGPGLGRAPNDRKSGLLCKHLSLSGLRLISPPLLVGPLLSPRAGLGFRTQLQPLVRSIPLPTQKKGGTARAITSGRRAFRSLNDSVFLPHLTRGKPLLDWRSSPAHPVSCQISSPEIMGVRRSPNQRPLGRASGDSPSLAVSLGRAPEERRRHDRPV